MAHIVQGLGRYWPDREQCLVQLPVVARPFPDVTGPLQLVSVVLPDWGARWGVQGMLAVPLESCADPVNPKWQDVDWWLAAFLLLECWHERVWERRHGVIHSYSFRLACWDERVWERAWVNRIALFLREWAAVQSEQRADDIFGPRPQAEVLMTHDVDAVAKTWSIRLKQGAFLGFNAVRMLAKGQLLPAKQRISQCFRFLFGRDDWWMIGAVQELEQRAGMRSQFNFYADDRTWDLARWLFDPGYDVVEPRLAQLLTDLAHGGWRIGLHQSHDAWQAPEVMRSQRERLQSLLPLAVVSCRQHWLRFGWEKTWGAQSEAGFQQDTTLMFNDRPGFRAAAALSWRPWDSVNGKSHQLYTLPTILMDSHFYDYQPMDAAERRAAFHYWLDELFMVGGEGALLWHPHTISADYGWGDGFRELIKILTEKQHAEICSS